MGLASFKFLQWAPKDEFFCSRVRIVSAVKGHSRPIIFVPIESAYATSY